MRYLGSAALFGVLLVSGCRDDARVPDRIELGDADFPDSSLDDSSVDGGGGMDVMTDVGGDVKIDGGAGGPILLSGIVVTPDTSFDGQVLIVGDKIQCAKPGTACASDPGAAGATTIDTMGIIAPGLIDTHNHILFDIFDDTDWLPMMSYMDHTGWPNEARYKVMLDVKQCIGDDSQGRPTWCPASYHVAGGDVRCEMNKWGELKGMIAGTTSIVGLPGTGLKCFESLSRSLDTPQNDLGVDTIATSALFPPSASSADSTCAGLASNKYKAYLIHCGEGIDPAALNEFSTLNTVSTTDGCLYAPQTAITHGTAFTATEFGVMAQHGMKLTWSPASNVALYGNTANIPAAIAAGLTISLAPDWSMGGSQNLLDEIRFADGWDNAHFGNILTSQDLVKMVTSNAAKVTGYDDRIGSIKEGYIADIMVVAGDRAHPFDAIAAAKPKDVRLTIVGGKVLYGDAALKAAGGAMCEDLDVCGSPKFVCVAEAATTDKLNQTYAQIKAALDAAMTDVDNVSGSAFKFSPVAPLVKCN